MRHFIVPTKNRVQKWKSFFSQAFQSSEQHKELMQMLIAMSMALAYDGIKKQNEFIELLESSFSMAEDLAARGLIYEEDTVEVGQLAYDFCTSLIRYLKEISVLTDAPTVMSFEGFVGMDMLIKFLDAGEPYVDEVEEKSCLKG